ncbi:MAG: DUF2518 family protein [Synechococcus sp. ELA057]|jgi:hypothetical protein
MNADPLLFQAGQWLGAASGVLALLTLGGFLQRWGIRFRLVGVTSFTALLAVSCLAFAISYTPRVSVPGAVVAPVVYDGGAELVIAAAPEGLAPEAYGPTALQVASNLRGGGRTAVDGRVIVRLRRIEALSDGAARPVVLAEAERDLVSGQVVLRP